MTQHWEGRDRQNINTLCEFGASLLQSELQASQRYRKTKTRIWDEQTMQRGTASDPATESNWRLTQAVEQDEVPGGDMTK